MVDLGPVRDLSGPSRLPCYCPVIDFNKQVTVNLSGLALSCDFREGTASFTLDIEVALSAYKSSKDHIHAPLQPIASILCIISKHDSSKLMPIDCSYVSVTGLLTDVTFRNDNRHNGIERFHVAVERIVCLASATTVDDHYQELHSKFSSLMSLRLLS